MTGPGPAATGNVLVVDDDPEVLETIADLVETGGHAAIRARNGAEALAALDQGKIDAVVTDIAMPELNGMELLRAVRARDPDTPILLVTGDPTLDTAIQALEHGAVGYLVKPVGAKRLVDAVARAVRLGRMARLKREALELLGESRHRAGDRAGLEAGFDRALAGLHMAYQPIVSWAGRAVHGYEALVRTREATFPHPGALLDGARRLGRLAELGRTIRRKVAGDLAESWPDGATAWINLHPLDLLDDDLFDGNAPLAAHASRVILEVTERASLDEIRDVSERMARLRRIGFRIAVDDLGAGYAGLTSFALLDPELVKIDRSLIAGVHLEPIKQRLVRSMVALCHEDGRSVVGEGVELAAEREALVGLGCDLLQGYAFARPGPPFPQVAWDA